MKRGDDITVRQLKKFLKLPTEDFCKILGINVSSYYNKTNNKEPWKLMELIKICEMLPESEEGLDIEVNGVNYRIIIRKANG